MRWNKRSTPLPVNSNSNTIAKLELRTRVLQPNAFNPLLSISVFSHWSIRLESFISAPMATGINLEEFAQRGQCQLTINIFVNSKQFNNLSAANIPFPIKALKLITSIQFKGFPMLKTICFQHWKTICFELYAGYLLGT